MALLGIAELLLILAFVAGYQKRTSYGDVLILHAISTVSSYRQYLDPFNNLLFFTAWTMLATCVALYAARLRHAVECRRSDTPETLKRDAACARRPVNPSEVVPDPHGEARLSEPVTPGLAFLEALEGKDGVFPLPVEECPP